MCMCVRDRKEVRGASQKRSGKMGALLGTMVIQRVPWLKGGVRKEVPLQICMHLWLVSVWTLIHLQGQLLGVGGQGRPRCVYVRRVHTCVQAE